RRAPSKPPRTRSSPLPEKAGSDRLAPRWSVARIIFRGHGRARASLSAGSPADGPAGRAAFGRGLPGAVDARRQPDQVAPRPYVLVLRDLRARRGAARAFIRLPVQLVLRGGRAAPSAAGARSVVAAVARRRAALSAANRRARARADRTRRRR